MALQFHLEASDEETQIRRQTAAIADKIIRPYAIEDDEKSRCRREVFDAIAAAGLHSLSQPREYGGGGRPHHLYYASLEELARASISASVSASVTNIVQGAISTFGTAGQKDTFLRPLTRGTCLGAFSLSEPQSGSDAAGLRLAAKRTPDGYRLTGTKVWCSNAGFADLYLVIARTGEHRTKGISSFLVPKDAPGFRIGKLEKKLGLRASTLAELIFEDCFIPEGQRLGAEGEGFSVALSQLDAGRISIGTAGVGAAIDALERAWKYLQARPQQFGEGVQQIFAEHFAGILAVKSMIQQVSARKDRGENISALGSAIKLMGSDLAVRVADDAVQYMGEAGVCREYEVERVLRDAKALQIVEGTNQIQRLVLSREIAAML